MQLNQQIELPWIAEARRHIGLAEIPGKQHNPTIIRWLTELKAWWHEDETPWCGTFVAHCLRTAGRDIPQHWYRAKAYAAYGRILPKPAYGCLAVFNRAGGGHVGFVVGQDKHGSLMILGGNQGNKVSIARFPIGRVIAYVWPSENRQQRSPNDSRYKLPRINLAGGFSSNEA